MQCHTAWGQWAVQLLQCTATPLGGSAQWDSCNARAHRLRGQVVLPSRRSLPRDQCIASMPGGSGQWSSGHTLPHCLGAVGSGTPAIHCLQAWGDGESCQGGGRCLRAELLQCTASLPGGIGQWSSCHAMPHYLGAVGSATPAIHCHTAWGQWAVEILPCTDTPPGDNGQWNSSNAPADQLRWTGTPA